MKKNLKSDHNSSPIETNCSLPPKKFIDKLNNEAKINEFERKIC